MQNQRLAIDFSDSRQPQDVFLQLSYETKAIGKHSSVDKLDFSWPIESVHQNPATPVHLHPVGSRSGRITICHRFFSILTAL
jgi:hypothetical protein